MELKDGENFRVIQGQKAKSKVVVHENYCFLVEKSDRNVRNKPVVYLKCQIASCPARAVIKDNHLTLSTERGRHDCNETAAFNLHKITVQEVLAKMKNRASKEGGSYLVSKL